MKSPAPAPMLPLLLPLFMLVLACSDAGEAPLDPAVERGRVVYLSVCVACHNSNPNLDGSVGPANAGSSRELIEGVVLRGEYPPGYTPKRPSQVMPQFANLEGSIDDLHAFLSWAEANLGQPAG